MFKSKAYKLGLSQCKAKSKCVINEGVYTIYRWINVFSMYGHSGVCERVESSVQ